MKKEKMRIILKTIVYIFFPPYAITYLLKTFDFISLTIEISVFLALFLNMTNIFLALVLFNFSKNKSNQLFMLINLGEWDYVSYSCFLLLH